MPFAIRHQPFGLLTEYVLENTDTGEYVSLLPAHGAMVRALVLRGGDTLVSLLKAPKSPQALIADETYASALLFPFPSRIRHGIYSFEGESYTLPMNETARNNAIHGFVAGRAFEVAGQRVTDLDVSMTLRFLYNGEVPGYPFPFDFRVTYSLTRDGQFSLFYEVQNGGTRGCPVAFGWHPYFTLNGEPVDNLTIELPVSCQILLDDTLLPVGEELFSMPGAMPLRDRTLDAAFVVADSPDGGVTTRLTSARQGLTLNLWQKTGPKGFGYLVVYTPAGRDSIAIEPLTSNVNAFNNGQGLIQLAPNGVATGLVRVTLTSDGPPRGR